MNCKAVPLQSPVSHSAHWVEMDKNNEPQRGSTMNLTKFVVSERRLNVGAGFLSIVEKHSCGRLLKIPELYRILFLIKRPPRVFPWYMTIPALIDHAA